MPRDPHPLRRGKEESLLEQVMRTRREIEDKQGNYFKPKEGVNRVRIMPSWRGLGETFYIQVPSHSDIGPNSKFATCLQFWQEACPICSTVEKLSMSTNSRDQNAASKMIAKDRCIVNVGYPNEPEGAVKPWAMSEFAFLEILAYFGDPDYGDFTHPKHGHDFVFTRKGTGLGTKYSNKHFAPKETPILIENAKKKLVNLDGFPKKLTRQELRAMLRGDDEE